MFGGRSSWLMAFTNYPGDAFPASRERRKHSGVAIRWTVSLQSGKVCGVPPSACYESSCRYRSLGDECGGARLIEDGHVLASLRPVLYQFDVCSGPGWLDGWEPGAGGVLASEVQSPPPAKPDHTFGSTQLVWIEMCSTFCARCRPAHGLQVSHWEKKPNVSSSSCLCLPPETICRVFAITSVPSLQKMPPPDLQITFADLIQSKWGGTVTAASSIRVEPAPRSWGGNSPMPAQNDRNNINSKSPDFFSQLSVSREILDTVPANFSYLHGTDFAPPRPLAGCSRLQDKCSQVVTIPTPYRLKGVGSVHFALMSGLRTLSKAQSTFGNIGNRKSPLIRNRDKCNCDQLVPSGAAAK